jgi:hypothetical protein
MTSIQIISNLSSGMAVAALLLPHCQKANLFQQLPVLSL